MKTEMYWEASRREIAENCALMDYYGASSSNFLATFRDNLSVPSSGLRNYHYSLRSNPEERISERNRTS